MPKFESKLVKLSQAISILVAILLLAACTTAEPTEPYTTRADYVIDIRVREDGKIEWQGKEIDNETLDDYLTQTVARKPEVRFVVWGAADPKKVAKVKALIREAGLTVSQRCGAPLD